MDKHELELPEAPPLSWTAAQQACEGNYAPAETEREYQLRTALARIASLESLVRGFRESHECCRDMRSYPAALRSQRKDWRCDRCKSADELLKEAK